MKKLLLSFGFWFDFVALSLVQVLYYQTSLYIPLSVYWIITAITSWSLLQKVSSLGFLKKLFGKHEYNRPTWSLKENLNKKVIALSFVGLIFASGIGSLVYYQMNKNPTPTVKMTFNSPVANYFYIPTIKGGVVSTKDLKYDTATVAIYFNESVAPLKNIGKDIKKGIKIFPKVKGKWTWKTDQRLVFTPDSFWPIGMKYKVVIKQRLIRSDYKLSEDTFNFTTVPYKVSISGGEFYENPKDPKDRKVIFTVKTNYPTYKANLANYIKIKQTDFGKDGSQSHQSLTNEIFANKRFDTFYIHSSKVDIPKEEGEVKLVINSGLKSMYGGLKEEITNEEKIRIPGIADYFHVEKSEIQIIRNSKDIPEHILMVKFSTGVSQKQLLNKIHLTQLPLYDKKAKRIHWPDLAYNLTKEKLDGFDKVNLVPMEAQGMYPKVHFFKISTAANTFHHILIDKGIKSGSNFDLVNSYDSISKAKFFDKEIKILGKGGILRLSGEKKLSIYTLNVKELEVTYGQLLDEQVQHVITQTYGDQDELKFHNKYKFSEKNIAYMQKETISVVNPSHRKPSYTALNLANFVGRTIDGKKTKGLFFIKVRDKNSRQVDERVILLTDLGIILKRENSEESHLFVQSLSHGGPVSGATVSVVTANGLSIFKKITDSQGHVKFPKMTWEDKAMGFIIKKGNDISYIRYSDNNRAINYSRFDTNGEYSSSAKQSLKAFLFSDRGIYRPGENVKIGFTVKAKKWNKSLKGLPMNISVRSANGKVLIEKSFELSKRGLGDFSFDLERSAPTGNYVVNLYSKSKRRGFNRFIGSTKIKVKEFTPDKLKVRTNLTKKILSGWVSPKDMKANVLLKNLFGIPAAGNNVRARMILEPVHLTFSKFKDFVFETKEDAIEQYTEELGEKVTDKKGEVTFDIPLEKFEKKIYRLRFFAQGFEKESGRSVVAADSTLVSDFKVLVGRKVKGSLEYIKVNDEKLIQFIAINPELEKVDHKGLKLELVERKYINALVQRANGSFGYESILKKTIVWKENFKIKSIGENYHLDTSKAGDFMLNLRDKNDKIISNLSYYVAGDRDLARSLNRNAELEVKLKSSDIDPGADIEFELKAPYLGEGLITIEQDGVYHYEWFKVNKLTGTYSVSTPNNIAGNAYLSIILKRRHNSREVYMSPLSYGAYSFSINSKEKRELITLKTPEVTKPGQDFTVTYSTQHASDIIVFAVDEGILQFGNYILGDPIKFYLKKKALQVNSWQTLDLLLPEHSILARHLAPGGGMYGTKGSRLNPFKRKLKKPIAFWSGVISASNKKKKWTFHVPSHFNGSLKVMAVAVGNKTLGRKVTSSFIRSELILNMRAPVVLAPNDKVKIPFNVLNNLDKSSGSEDINFSIKTTSQLQNLGKKEIKSVSIKHQEEKGVTYSYQASEELGAGEVSFNAKFGSATQSLTETFSLRPATPLSRMSSIGAVQDSSEEFKFNRNVYSELEVRRCAVSTSPLSLALPAVNYLKTSNYHCSEQLISRAFPHLLLFDSEIWGKSKANALANIERTLHILRARQKYSGDFSIYNSSEGEGKNKVTLHAIQFLIEAKDRQVYVSKDMMQKSLRWLKKKVNKFSDIQERAYGIYLLTRMQMVTTPFLLGLEKELAKLKSYPNESIVNAYVASIYALILNEKKAQEYISKVSISEMKHYYKYPYYGNVSARLKILYLMAKHFPDNLNKIDGKKLIKYFTLDKGHLNTINSAYAILAAEAIQKASGKQIKGKASFIEKMEKGEKSFAINKSFEVRVFDKTIKSVEIKNESDAALFYSCYHEGYDKKFSGSKINGMEIYKSFTNTDDKEIKSVKLGEEITVHLRFKAANKSFEQGIIIDKLPGGFDMVANSISGHSTKSKDIREDRILFYTDVQKNVSEISYKIKATHAGEFKVPAAMIEDMYLPSARGVSDEAVIQVESL